MPAALQLDEGCLSPRSAAESAAKKRVSTGRSSELHAHHREIALKLDHAREATVTAGCTFQPLLSSRQSNRTFEHSDDAFNHLYRDGERRREKLQQAQAEADAAAATFRPDTTATANSPFSRKEAAAAAATAAALNATAAGGDPDALPPPPSLTRRHEALYEDAKARPQRVQQAAAAAYADYTFRPDTNATKRFNSKHLRAHSAMPLVDRLYERERLAARGDDLAARRTALELEDCTFSPRVRRLSAPPSSRRADADNNAGDLVVHERLYGDAGRIAEARGRRQRELEQESAAPCTFQPSLVARARARLAAGVSASLSPPRSRPLAAAGGAGDGVYARLYRQAQEMNERRLAATANKADPECTFAPKMPGAANAAHETEQEGSRLEALYRHGKELQDRRMRAPQDPTTAIRAREEAAELAECTFAPDTSATKSSPYRKADRGAPDALVADLYTAGVERQERARAEALARAQEGATFAPTLVAAMPATSPRRQQRAGGTTVFEDLHAAKAKVVEAQRDVREKVQAEECTFKPTLVARSPKTAKGRKQQQEQHVKEEEVVPLAQEGQEPASGTEEQA